MQALVSKIPATRWLRTWTPDHYEWLISTSSTTASFWVQSSLVIIITPRQFPMISQQTNAMYLRLGRDLCCKADAATPMCNEDLYSTLPGIVLHELRLKTFLRHGQKSSAFNGSAGFSIILFRTFVTALSHSVSVSFCESLYVRLSVCVYVCLSLCFGVLQGVFQCGRITHYMSRCVNDRWLVRSYHSQSHRV